MRQFLLPFKAFLGYLSRKYSPFITASYWSPPVRGGIFVEDLILTLLFK